MALPPPPTAMVKLPTRAVTSPAGKAGVHIITPPTTEATPPTPSVADQAM